MEISSSSFHSQRPAVQASTNEETDLNVQNAIQYAYENNLVTDHRLNSFSITHLFGPLIQSTIPEADHEYGLTDDSHLTEVEIPTPLPWERLSTTDGALRLIRESRCALTDGQIQQFTQDASFTPNLYLKSLKVELPVLRTDNEWDLKEFNKEKAGRVLDLYESLNDHGLPLHPQDVGLGEGMDVPLDVHAQLATLMQEVEIEKVAVTKDSFQYLISQLRNPLTHADRMSALVESTRYEKNPAMEKLTPPVSPKLNRNHLPFAFEPAVLPDLGDCSSTLSENFHSIEEALLGDHQDTWSENTSSFTELLQNDFTVSEPEDPFSWDYNFKSFEDLKVELPLMLDPDPEPPSLSGPDMFKDIIGGAVDLDPEFEKMCMHDFSDDVLEEQLQAAAENAKRLTEQEKLQAVDAIARVPVPLMDFSLAEPEWARLRCNAVAMFKWIRTGCGDLFRPPSWPPNRVIESKLIWSPIRPGSHSSAYHENMDDGKPLVQNFLQPVQESEVLGSISLVKQRTKPTAFSDAHEDEEIEILGKDDSTTDLLDIVRKRSKNLKSTQPLKKLCTSTKLSPLHVTKNTAPVLLSGGSPGAPAKLLANFLELHAPKKQPITHSRYFAPNHTDTPRDPSPHNALEEKGKGDDQKAHPGDGCLQHFARERKAPLPALNLPKFPLTAFVSINVSRRIIRAVESLMPNLTLIERNHEAHNTSIWRHNSVARTEIVPDLANDADFSISPSTGLLIMSMIRIRQKPRTEMSKSLAESRIEKASLRYGRVVVLIGGEGGSDDSLRDLPSCDLAAIQDLQGFSSGLDCHIQVQYVGGGDKTIAAWVASCLCRYSIDQPEIFTGLSEMETLWELFLRRAGFNAFAAQAVLAQLKPPSVLQSTAEVPNVIQHGLGAFVVMSRAERMRIFGELVGPMVLERVNRAIDEIWNR